MSDLEKTFLQQLKLLLIRGIISLMVVFIGFIAIEWLRNRDYRQAVRVNIENIEKKLDTNLFDLYIAGINDLIQSNYELIEKDTNHNKEQIKLLQKENEEIREELMSIIKQVDFKARGMTANKL